MKRRRPDLGLDQEFRERTSRWLVGQPQTDRRRTEETLVRRTVAFRRVSHRRADHPPLAAGQSRVRARAVTRIGHRVW
jgi:hypothetical protein